MEEFVNSGRNRAQKSAPEMGRCGAVENLGEREGVC